MLDPQVLFYDATMQTNDCDWAFYAPCVYDENGKLIPIAFVLTEEDKTAASQNWTLQQLVRMIPQLKDIVLTVFSDGAISEETLKVAFPKCVSLLCMWHMYKNLQQNVGRHPCYHEILSFIR